MAGQIIKRGDKQYLVRIFLGRDPDTGKRRYLNQMVYGTKRDAEQTRTALLRAKDTNTLTQPVKMSLNSLLDRWLETVVKPRVSERTHRDYTWKAGRYLRSELGERLLANVKPYDIQTLYAEMLGRGLSPKTVRHAQNILHNAFEQAVRWGLVNTNPAQHIDLPKQQHKEMRAMSELEAGRFLVAAKSDPLHAFFALMVGTGLRPSEAAGLKWSDLDPVSGMLSVQRTVVRPKGGGWRFDHTKTKRGRRTLALPAGLITTLLSYEDATPPNEHGLMFSTGLGEALELNNVRNRNFAAVQERAGLVGYNLYSLRHTHATLLLLAGVHPKIVSERLGHATIAITLDTYSHVLPNMQQEAAAKLDALLYSPQTSENATFKPAN